MKTNKIRVEKRTVKLLNKLRKNAFELSSTRDDKVLESEDLSKGELDSVFDIDIFLSRKPGMRRSVQIISSDQENPDMVKLSCMTALASLFDTMTMNSILNMTEQDIIDTVKYWAEMHNIKF